MLFKKNIYSPVMLPKNKWMHLIVLVGNLHNTQRIQLTLYKIILVVIIFHQTFKYIVFSYK